MRTNLQQTVLGQKLHPQWTPTGGNAGNSSMSDFPGASSQPLPPNLIVSAHWDNTVDERLNIAVLFDGTDKSPPTYTIRVYDGHDTLARDQLHEEPAVAVDAVKSTVERLMAEYARDPSLTDKLRDKFGR